MSDIPRFIIEADPDKIEVFELGSEELVDEPVIADIFGRVSVQSVVKAGSEFRLIRGDGQRQPHPDDFPPQVA
jgi:hypothetical protein